MLNRGNAVIPRRQLLQESVPVERSAFLRANDVVADIYGNDVSPIDLNRRGGKSSIDEQSTPVDTVRRNEATGDVEIIVASYALVVY